MVGRPVNGARCMTCRLVYCNNNNVESWLISWKLVIFTQNAKRNALHLCHLDHTEWIYIHPSWWVKLWCILCELVSLYVEKTMEKPCRVHVVDTAQLVIWQTFSELQHLHNRSHMCCVTRTQDTMVVEILSWYGCHEVTYLSACYQYGLFMS